MPANNPCEEYHKWYYDNEVWEDVQFLGVVTNKSVSDMWNYQEILAELQPGLIVEFGTRFGGSALYFSVIGRAINPQLKVLSVDVSHAEVAKQVHDEPSITLVTASSTDPQVADIISEMRRGSPGRVFFILDSDHSKNHVLAELSMLRSLVQPGDYVVVEDGNINGHPVLPGWGEGPKEALEAYFEMHPDDYSVDAKREAKFGFTFAPSGFLLRN
jgi:cephalosporin hydroxylase